MMGWRARLGILVPPGNPTLEPEVVQLTPKGVSSHFTRMVATGETGSHSGQDERNRTQIVHLDENVALLALVKPGVIALGHTATSYTLGVDGEARLVGEMSERWRIPFITAFGSVVAALRHLGVRRIAYGTPYNEQTTLQGKAHLEAYGFDVVSFAVLPGVRNIYDESSERAYGLGRRVDAARADVVFLSGVGMPTLDAIDLLERDLGKPVISSVAAMMWHALDIVGVREPVQGAGRLLLRAS